MGPGELPADGATRCQFYGDQLVQGAPRDGRASSRAASPVAAAACSDVGKRSAIRQECRSVRAVTPDIRATSAVGHAIAVSLTNPSTGPVSPALFATVEAAAAAVSTPVSGECHGARVRGGCHRTAAAINVRTSVVRADGKPVGLAIRDADTPGGAADAMHPEYGTSKTPGRHLLGERL